MQLLLSLIHLQPLSDSKALLRVSMPLGYFSFQTPSVSVRTTERCLGHQIRLFLPDGSKIALSAL